MIEIQRPCVWCGQLMTTKTKAKTCCSNKCQSGFARWKLSTCEFATKAVAVEILTDYRNVRTHPCSYHLYDEQAYMENLITCELWKAATKVMNELPNHFSQVGASK